MTENSNSKAFGVKDLKPNTSHLIPGKTSDGSMVDPLQTAKHSRDEVDELIALGKEARGEVEHKATVIKSQPVLFSGPAPSEEVFPDPGIVDWSGSKGHLLPDMYFHNRLIELENKLEALEERLIKAFKHAGFNF